MTLAKVDVPTYTQRLIDDLKRHEDEFRKKQLESFSKNAEVEVKDPFRVEYKVTKGELDPDILPDE
jgi:rubrerythrin